VLKKIPFVGGQAISLLWKGKYKNPPLDFAVNPCIRFLNLVVDKGG
jgi:hypothetical protein